MKKKWQEKQIEMKFITKHKRKIIILAVGAAIVFALDWWGFSMKPVYYTVSSDKEGAPIRVVFISDLHNSFYGGHDQSGLWKTIESANPDIVMFGGDVIDSRAKGKKNAYTLMKLVADKYPCAYATGNHEQRRSDKEEFFSKVEEIGVPVLNGRYTDFMIKNRRVRVFGIIGANIFDENGSQLKTCYSAAVPDTYNILLAHEPQEFFDITSERSKYNGNGFDLILSGHAHGGQWRIPGILDQGLYAPDQWLFPDFTTGQRTDEGTTQIVSRGLARNLNMIMIPRIFNRPELSIIDIE